ncbi:MAG: class IV adenylate cyclase [Bacteroidetes bacterium]|nr:class IV adenylate cyclase [Bacteroidota bacterium]
MARNLELKARCQSLERAELLARRLGARRSHVLHQVDTYLDIPSGRLKLREVRGGRTELIFYDRPANASKDGRWSFYVVYPVIDRRRSVPALLRARPVAQVVKKRRVVYLFVNARIHLDEVEHLGQFIEFEVVMDHGAEQARRLYRALLEAFGIRTKDLIGGSYAEMPRPLRRKRRLAIFNK